MAEKESRERTGAVPPAEGVVPERGAAPYASDTSTVPPVRTGGTAGTVVDEDTEIARAPDVGDALRTPEPTAAYDRDEPQRR